MEKDEIHFGDIKRWLFGAAPPQFMIEVLIRTVLIYIILLIIVRLMGKRMSGQVSITEMAVMITLGAIVSPAMQLPDRGLFFGILGLLVALVFQRGYNYFGAKNSKVEDLTQGTLSLVVKDGELNLEELSKARLTKQELYAMLRQKKVQNLASVSRAYFESCGVLSIFETKEKKPGLPLFPQKDKGIISEVLQHVDHGLRACSNCGHVQHIGDLHANKCAVCNETAWIDAFIEKDKSTA